MNNFKYHRSLAQIRCALAQPDAAELTRLWSDAYGHLLATVNSPGALAMVVNMENHPGWGSLVAKSAQQPWPKEYQGKSRMIVPCVRSVVGRYEKVELTVIILDNQPAKSAVLYWRPLGRGAWQRRGLSHVGRAIYRVALPPATEAFEYWLAAGTAGGRQLVWPVTAPDLNQTVVVLEQGI